MTIKSKSKKRNKQPQLVVDNDQPLDIKKAVADVTKGRSSGEATKTKIANQANKAFRDGAQQVQQRVNAYTDTGEECEELVDIGGDVATATCEMDDAAQECASSIQSVKSQVKPDIERYNIYRMSDDGDEHPYKMQTTIFSIYLLAAVLFETAGIATVMMSAGAVNNIGYALGFAAMLSFFTVGGSATCGYVSIKAAHSKNPVIGKWLNIFAIIMGSAITAAVIAAGITRLDIMPDLIDYVAGGTMVGVSVILCIKSFLNGRAFAGNEAYHVYKPIAEAKKIVTKTLKNGLADIDTAYAVASDALDDGMEIVQDHETELVQQKKSVIAAHQNLLLKRASLLDKAREQDATLNEQVFAATGRTLEPMILPALESHFCDPDWTIPDAPILPLLKAERKRISDAREHLGHCAAMARKACHDAATAFTASLSHQAKQ